MPKLRLRSILAGAFRVDAVPAMQSSNLRYGRNDLPGHAQAAGGLVSGHVLAGEPKKRRKGYIHPITVVKGKKESASELLPRIHLVASLLKRWMLGTHQGAVSHEHLEFYLDEFTFRFNRRHSKNRGKLFYRMVQQAVAIDPVSYKSMRLYGTNGANRDHNR